MARFDKNSTARLRADHERSMSLIGNGGIIVHPFHAVSNGMQGEAIMEQRSGMQRRVFFFFIVSCLLVASFLISQTNLNRISLYQQSASEVWNTARLPLLLLPPLPRIP
jgi:hypothetical protein